MGVVYEAYDPELHRKLALKVLQPDAGGSTSTARAASCQFGGGGARGRWRLD